MAKIYKCLCGEQLLIDSNTEESRRRKRKFKTAHKMHRRNPGHKWTRFNKGVEK